ncbi:MAG: GntR family transcriptional regulator [Chloroflexota bacterium]
MSSVKPVLAASLTAIAGELASPALDAGQSPTFEPVRHPSLSESILVHLRRAIINGKLPPGERLVETDLADQFHVSRATIRQALLQLSFEGLVEVRPRRGTVVTRMSSKVARDVCTVRGLLEGWMARSAAMHLGETELGHMRDVADAMGAALRAGDIYRVVELDLEYHGSIARSDPNERLHRHWASLSSSHGALMSSRLAYYNYDPQTVITLHRDLCDVLESHDPDSAEAAVRLHYMGTHWEDTED